MARGKKGVLSSLVSYSYFLGPEDLLDSIGDRSIPGSRNFSILISETGPF